MNADYVDVVSLQHEYGIFGGKAGNHVATLMRELSMPVVTTLHTILTAPSPEQRSSVEIRGADYARVPSVTAH